MGWHLGKYISESAASIDRESKCPPSLATLHSRKWPAPLSQAPSDLLGLVFSMFRILYADRMAVKAALHDSASFKPDNEFSAQMKTNRSASQVRKSVIFANHPRHSHSRAHGPPSFHLSCSLFCEVHLCVFLLRTSSFASATLFEQVSLGGNVVGDTVSCT